MPMPPILPLIAVILSGLAIAVQAPLNASLGKALGAPLPAAAVSFGVGFVVLVALSVITGTASYARLPSVPIGLWAGGLLGAFYVTAVIWGIPILGALTTVAALILGQIAGALIVDSIGAFGLAVQEITPKRLAAAGLVAAGLVLSRL
jgi:transporter family-2 protein